MITLQGKAESATEQEPTPTTIFPPGLTPHPAMHQLLIITQTQAHLQEIFLVAACLNMTSLPQLIILINP